LSASGTRPTRLLLVDDQPAVRRGLKMRFALEPDMEVAGEAGNVTEAIFLARALRPDVVVMDVEVSDADGVAVTEALHAAAPESAVVILTLRDDVATQKRARAAGAAAFVTKHQTEETLLAAIRRVANERRGGSGPWGGPNVEPIR
jgi:DNA-binding NarL/FixJ family response regulator